MPDAPAPSTTTTTAATPAAWSDGFASPRPGSRGDLVLADVPMPQFSGLAVSATLNLLGTEAFQSDLATLQETLREHDAAQREVIASGLVLTGGLSVGYVVWLVRGGVLASSMLSALPAWQMIDPLPVLAAAQRERTGASAPQGADHEVERLFDRRRKPAAKTHGITGDGVAGEPAKASEPAPEARA